MSKCKEAVEHQKRLNEAHEVLGSHTLRAKYDAVAGIGSVISLFIQIPRGQARDDRGGTPTRLTLGPSPPPLVNQDIPPDVTSEVHFDGASEETPSTMCRESHPSTRSRRRRPSTERRESCHSTERRGRQPSTAVRRSGVPSTHGGRGVFDLGKTGSSCFGTPVVGEGQRTESQREKNECKKRVIKWHPPQSRAKLQRPRRLQRAMRGACHAVSHSIEKFEVFLMYRDDMK